MKEQLASSVHTIQTTIGELVEALTQVASESAKTEQESYELATQTLQHILGRSEEDLEIYF